MFAGGVACHLHTKVSAPVITERGPYLGEINEKYIWQSEYLIPELEGMGYMIHVHCRPFTSSPLTPILILGKNRFLISHFQNLCYFGILASNIEIGGAMVWGSASTSNRLR